ncbi:MAG: gluconate 2-dehydrogenase subunit 3 family protein [Acidobacteriia bacterium]|nr:gluconate 2-dehydrogenase subunit 3 family protein [Terriglobia bacterium]
MAEEKPSFEITRRTVIASATLVPVTALTASAQSPPAALTAAQRQILEAFVDRLCPKDDLGAGAVECGAANYIDQQLAGYLSSEKEAMVAGLAAVDAYARNSQGGPFAGLSAEKRDAILTAVENGSAAGVPNGRAFFTRLRRLTLEGMFGDPYYGGNTNFAGWDLIQYPGPRLAVGPEEQKMSKPATPYHRSAWGTEHSGH